jgi:hypothetical protein
VRATRDADAVKIAVLRHQVAVLHRQVPRARYTPADRMLLALLVRFLPRERRAVFLVTPSVAAVASGVSCRRWTYPRTGTPSTCGRIPARSNPAMQPGDAGCSVVPVKRCPIEIR